MPVKAFTTHTNPIVPPEILLTDCLSNVALLFVEPATVSTDATESYATALTESFIPLPNSTDETIAPLTNPATNAQLVVPLTQLLLLKVTPHELPPTYKRELSSGSMAAALNVMGTGDLEQNKFVG